MKKEKKENQIIQTNMFVNLLFTISKNLESKSKFNDKITNKHWYIYSKHYDVAVNQ